MSYVAITFKVDVIEGGLHSTPPRSPAALAADRYGLDVDNNILQGIPPSIALYVVALLVTIQLCLSSAVGNSALFQHIEDLLKIPRDFCIQRCIIRSSIVALAVFLGESVPRFDLVMGLVGSTLTGPLMFIFPPLFFLKLCHIKSNLSKSEFIMAEKKQNGRLIIQNGDHDHNLSKFPINFKTNKTYRTFINYEGEEKGGDSIDEYRIKWYDVVLASLVMLLGVGATGVAMYSSWSNTISSAIFSPPCLVNATAAARSFLEKSSLPL